MVVLISSSTIFGYVMELQYHLSFIKSEIIHFDLMTLNLLRNSWVLQLVSVWGKSNLVWFDLFMIKHTLKYYLAACIYDLLRTEYLQ